MQETFYRLTAPLELKIALLSDIHDRPFDEIIASISRERPDLIAIAGDIVYGTRPAGQNGKLAETKNALPFLKACASLAPSFFSPGNHEYMLTDTDFDRIRETGVTLLHDSWTWFDPPCSGLPSAIAVGGLSSARLAYYQRKKAQANDIPLTHSICSFFDRFRYTENSPHPLLEWMDEFEKADAYKILLCHHPEYWEPHLRDRRIDLVLSGHAHGGQIRAFKRGFVATGQGLMPRYTAGVHSGPNGSIVISRGLANTAEPIPRWGNPCELVYILLNRA